MNQELFNRWFNEVFRELDGPDDYPFRDLPNEDDDEIAMCYCIYVLEHMEIFEHLAVDRVGTGLTYILGSESPLGCAFIADQPSNALRVVSAVRVVFERYYAKHCGNEVIVYNNAPCDVITWVCFMCWDIFPRMKGSDIQAIRPVDKYILEIMKESLYLENLTCIQSGLHGLGHWHRNYADIVESTINEFLVKQNNLLEIYPEIRRYAENARDGHVL